MLRVRIFAAGAVLVIAATGALAQSNSPPGKPLPILKIDHQPGKTKAKAHAALHGKSAAKPAKMASHRKAAPKLAATRHKNHAVVARMQHQPAPTPTPENAGSTLSAAVPPTAPSASIAPSASPAPPTSGTASIPQNLVVESQSASLAHSSDVAAAPAGAPNAPMPNDGIKPPTAAPGDKVAAKTDKLGDIIAPPAQRIAQAFIAAPAQRSTVGSASWIAKVFGALGGAVAAGSVAWFLIGPALPLKTES
jgi:hypothetical protein